tara:strand:- start:404 stop:1054 length:651 start_codon:yes stop_codon:yes gene_type:complete
MSINIASNYKKLKAQIPKGINLLAVSKGNSSTSIRQLIELGQFHFGESKLQEALPKIGQLREFSNLTWHFIGRIQSNKVRGILKSFDVIHSVDSLLLAEKISRISLEEKKTPRIMFQVKLRDDPQKGGFLRNEILDMWPKLCELPNLQTIGLMTMSPIDLKVNERILLFRECRLLADQLKLRECSMGMSQDWMEAIQEGATWLRLGSSLFRNRIDK